MEELVINGRTIGESEPPYIIAEIGANHNGDMELCKRLIDEAKASGVDAVKFQSWSKTSLISKAEYKRNTQYQDKHKHFGSLEEMVEKYQFTPDQHFEVAEYCKENNITFLSSCFSMEEVDLLESVGVPCYKIASMDINNLELLKYVARKNKPVLLSTGMATLGEIESAITSLSKSGEGPIALLHCVSIYPVLAEDINLRNMITLKRAFNVNVGFSDHSDGIAISLAATALGAVIIEKHFTLDKEMAGWDHAISAEPDEMELIVSKTKEVFYSLGSAERIISKGEFQKRKAFRRSVVAIKDLKKGHKIKESDITFKRPGTGISPNEVFYIIGRTLNRDLISDDELAWSDFL